MSQGLQNTKAHQATYNELFGVRRQADWCLSALVAKPFFTVRLNPIFSTIQPLDERWRKQIVTIIIQILNVHSIKILNF